MQNQVDPALRSAANNAAARASSGTISTSPSSPFVPNVGQGLAAGAAGALGVKTVIDAARRPKPVPAAEIGAAAVLPVGVISQAISTLQAARVLPRPTTGPGELQ